MKVSMLLPAAIAAIVMSAGGAEASDRYATRPPVLVSPDLSAPWVMQLQNRQTRRTVPTAVRRQNREVLVHPLTWLVISLFLIVGIVVKRIDRRPTK